jgi:hypothetical protein
LCLGYPFLLEAKIVAVSDEWFRYTVLDGDQVIPVPHNPAELSNWRRTSETIEDHCSRGNVNRYWASPSSVPR